MPDRPNPDKLEAATGANIGSLDYFKSLEKACESNKELGLDGVHANGHVVKKIEEFLKEKFQDQRAKEVFAKQKERAEQQERDRKRLDIDRPSNAWNKRLRPPGL